MVKVRKEKERKGKKKQAGSRLKKHPWDETMVIIVMVASVLCILLMLANYMGVVGKAYSGMPTAEGVVEMLSRCELVSGGEVTKCSIKCVKETGKDCVLAWQGEELKGCREKIRGEHSCLCCKS